MSRLRAPCVLVLGAILVGANHDGARAQEPIIDAVSRESTIFNNADPPPAITDAASREFTVFHPEGPARITEACSREFTVFNDLGPGDVPDVVSREFTVFNDTALTEILDAVSREFVAWNMLPEGIEDQRIAPEAFTLLPARPNPMDKSTMLTVGLPWETTVTLAIYDIDGSKVVTIIDRTRLGAGWHQVRIDASRWPAGIYFYRLQAGAITRTAKITVQR